MKKFYLPVFWNVSAYHIIEAETLEEAQEVADDAERWTGVHAHLDALPKPEQEESCDDYDRFPDHMREATPEEIQTAEAPSAREALRARLEALRVVGDNPRVMETMVIPQDAERVRAAITKAEKALGEGVSE